jgi:hypothetical protein
MDQTVQFCYDFWKIGGWCQKKIYPLIPKKVFEEDVKYIGKLWDDGGGYPAHIIHAEKLFTYTAMLQLSMQEPGILGSDGMRRLLETCHGIDGMNQQLLTQYENNIP